MRTIKRYELTQKRDNQGLYQIRAILDNPLWNVKAGDVGGWVESENNLRQDGMGWIFEGASVQGNSVVQHALLKEGTHVFGKSVLHNGIFEKSHIKDSDIVDGNITDSNIENCLIHQHLEAIGSYMKGVEATKLTVTDSTFQGVVKMFCKDVPISVCDSFIHVADGLIGESCEFKYVHLEGGSLEIKMKTHLEKVIFSKKDVLVTCRYPLFFQNKASFSKHEVVVIGADNQFVQIDAENIVFEGVEITGGVRITGYYVGLTTTVLRDSAEIFMTGVIQNSSLCEFSKIKDKDFDKQRGVQNVSLSGDEIYTFE